MDISPDKAFLRQVASCQCVFTARRHSAYVEYFCTCPRPSTCVRSPGVLHDNTFPGFPKRFSVLAAFAAWGSCIVQRLPLLPF